MKIVSLLPSATEIVCALGLENQLVAVSHECDYPPTVSEKPILTASRIHTQLHRSVEIDENVARHSGNIYELNSELLDELRPELILTQELCSVCAVSYTEVKEAASILRGDVSIVSLEPNNLEDIMENILLVGRLTAKIAEAEKLVAQLRSRLAKVKSRARLATYRPRVFFMEWLKPPWVGGHWIPQMVEYAGGIDGLGNLGRPSSKVLWEKILAYKPEIMIVSPCGFDLNRIMKEVHVLSEYRGLDTLPAFISSRIYAVNASAYYSRPGPRTIEGLEILAHIIHPELFSENPYPAAVKLINGSLVRR